MGLIEDLNDGESLVHLVAWPIEMTKKPETSKHAGDILVTTFAARFARRRHLRKIRMVMAGLGDEGRIWALCYRKGMAESLYCSWLKGFLEAGKRRLSGDLARGEGSAP